MKKVSLLLMLILALGSTSCIVGGWDNSISGNGNVEKENRSFAWSASMMDVIR